MREELEKSICSCNSALFLYFLPVFRIALLFAELLQVVALSAITVRL